MNLPIWLVQGRQSEALAPALNVWPVCDTFIEFLAWR
jgi:hypothetical protein